MDAPASEPLFQLELPIREAWSNAEGLRNAVIRCLETVYDARELCDMYGMVVAELVENALKYGRWHRGMTLQRTSTLQLEGDAKWVCIEVTHPVAPESAALPRLFETLQRLTDAPSAEALYHARLREVATGTEGASGLGLARIAY